MITKKEAQEIAIQYLRERKRDYIEVAKEDDIFLQEDEEIIYGERKGEFTPQYSV